MSTLKITNVSKYYGKKKVLDKINIQMEHGIFGLLGPSGAGKTTLIKCIVGLIDYQGFITLEKVRKKDISVYTGYLPQNFSLFKQLTVREALEYISILKKVEDSKEIDRIIKETNLWREQSKKIKNLSEGMLRSLGIAQALLVKPKILIIDEPTLGLEFRKLLINLSRDMIIIVSSHIVEDLDLITDEIAIMNKGKILRQGNLNDLLYRLKGKVGIKEIKREEFEEYNDLYNVISVKHHHNAIRIRIVGDNLPEDIQFDSPNLEDLYSYLIGNL
ncbi:ATP-binding cassette domain-containing protein [Clostridium sp. D2Q-14]|uniref:ATP-binding cassette domain-containing protein n=1 Tax=Anaeromonas gelatinilytica TaxID=2683194 RepID=UPI00193B85B0|nr:ATP-binding cassette domain-containing protein [Anaeromonas gelatinilytica]MBS4534595.1 ATP-binding cassette domain-containing protein [Anaeromonas gelatinilytica]